VTIEDANLAVDGAGCASVSVGVEADGLDEVLVAVLQVEADARLFVAWREDTGREWV
jgi:hypothetical protein